MVHLSMSSADRKRIEDAARKAFESILPDLVARIHIETGVKDDASPESSSTKPSLPKPLSEMKVKDLNEFAKANGIKFPPKSKKADKQRIVGEWLG